MSEVERRRGIALVLERQPEIDLDELQRILGRVGIGVDTDTLVADLDALGYDVDDDPTAVAPADEDPAYDDADHDEDTAYDEVDDHDHDLVEDEPDLVVDDHHGEDSDEGWSWSRHALVVAAGVLVAVIIVVVFLNLGDGDDTASEGPTPIPGEGDDQATTTAATEPRIAPVGPGNDPALDVPETRTDDFERGDIGDFPDVGTWELLSGEWANTDGNLDLTAPPVGTPAVAAVDVGTGDVRAEVKIDRPGSRAGLAFRIVDERNFFVWTTVPEYETAILYRVVDGVAEPVADSGLTTTDDGLPALGVNLVGDQAELLHEGVVVATFDGIGPAEGATRIGVAVLPDVEALPMFDEFKVLTASS